MQDEVATLPTQAPGIVPFPVLRARLRPDRRGEERAAVLRLRLLPRPPFWDPRGPRSAA